MINQRTFTFHNWVEPDTINPGSFITRERTITFTYEKGLIRNNITDKIIPSTEEEFHNIMKTYADMPDVTEI